MFKPFQPDAELRIHRGNLPHWRQKDVTYFVNGRLADSIPQSKLRQWDDERLAWLKRHGFESKEELDARADDSTRNEFHARCTKRWHEWLDAGFGDRVLRGSELRQHMIARLSETADNGHCDLDAWVIMPNHFHALVTPRPGVELGTIIQKWKGGSARAINLALGRKGKLWQAEPFDHIVRSEPQFLHYRRYIADNPIKPNLPDGDYSLGLGKVVWASAQSLKAHLETNSNESESS